MKNIFKLGILALLFTLLAMSCAKETGPQMNVVTNQSQTSSVVVNGSVLQAGQKEVSDFTEQIIIVCNDDSDCKVNINGWIIYKSGVYPHPSLSYK